MFQIPIEYDNYKRNEIGVYSDEFYINMMFSLANINFP